MAIEKGLSLSRQSIDYSCCGKGCKLDFIEDPERFLDLACVPAM